MSMRIKYNGDWILSPEENMTIQELLEWKGCKTAGSAVAINDRIVPRSNWPVTKLCENDDIVVISAAFGG